MPMTFSKVNGQECCLIVNKPVASSKPRPGHSESVRGERPKPLSPEHKRTPQLKYVKRGTSWQGNLIIAVRCALFIS